MVSIIPAERTSADVIGKLLGESLQRTLPGAIEKGYDRKLMQNSLDQISNIAKDESKSPLDLTLEVLKAGAGIPGSEKYIGQVLPKILEIAAANRSQKIPFAGENIGSLQIPSRQELPQFGQTQPSLDAKQNNFFPNNLGPQGGPGNAPQAVTLGNKYKMLPPEQRIAEGRRIAQENTRNGNPMTVKEGIAQVDEYIAYADAYNQKVEQDRQARVESQENYGNIAVEELRKVFPKQGENADPILTPEVESIFRKKGEEKSRAGDSEADIKRYLVKEANKFKNSIVNVRKDLDAPRSQNLIGRIASGNYKSAEKSAEDLRKTLNPILDLGLYDVARSLLQEKGYGAEERDFIINPLSEKTKILFNQLPEKPKRKIYRKADENKVSAGVQEVNNLENLKDVLRQIAKNDPNFSLVLGRKIAEDKGYDWRNYKDVINQLIDEDAINLTDDQRSQLGLLDTPPLNNLDAILQGLNLIGR